MYPAGLSFAGLRQYKLSVEKFADFCVTCAHNAHNVSCGQGYKLTSNPLKGTIVSRLRVRVAPGALFI